MNIEATKTLIERGNVETAINLINQEAIATRNDIQV